MARRTIVYLVISLLAAAVFVRLGVWQISRLHERRAYNAAVSARLAEPSGTIRSLPADTAGMHFRRVHVAGRPDYTREIVLIEQSRQGSPGVHVITPVRVAGSDTLLLVNRGWIYSPNSADADLGRWREEDSLSADGWVEIPRRRSGAATLSSKPRAFRWLEHAAVERVVGAPVTSYYVVLDPPPGDPPRDRPVRIPRPSLDEGPHRSYAFQWFFFATLAVVGAAAFARSERARR